MFVKSKNGVEYTLYAGEKGRRQPVGAADVAHANGQRVLHTARLRKVEPSFGMWYRKKLADEIGGEGGGKHRYRTHVAAPDELKVDSSGHPLFNLLLTFLMTTVLLDSPYLAFLVRSSISRWWCSWVVAMRLKVPLSVCCGGYRASKPDMAMCMCSKRAFAAVVSCSFLC